MEVAVVTGAGRGLGHAIAARLAGRGLAVLATDVNLEAAERTAAEIGRGAWARALDVRDEDACRRVAEEASERGRLAVWVNNAGVLRGGRVWEQPREEVDLMVGANLLGVLYGSRVAVNAMGERGGRILNIASMSVFGPVPGLAVYGATKHGVYGLSLSLEAELREAGLPIGVRVFCPDSIDTGLIREQVHEPGTSLIWTAPKVLGVEEAADAAIELLYGRAVRKILPRRRAFVTRGGEMFPRTTMKLLPLIRRAAEAKRQRAHRETAG